MKEENKNIGLPVLVLTIGLGIVVLFTWLFSELSEMLIEEELQGFDSRITLFFDRSASPALDTFYTIVTELGSVEFLAAASIILILFLWFKMKDIWGIMLFSAALGGGGILTAVMKESYERNRPSINEAVDATGFSFPSGHAVGSLIFYGFVAYLIVRSSRQKGFKIWVLVLSVILILLIGASRIYLGAHFPSDIVAGYTVGTIWLILCLMVLEWIEWQSNSDVRPVHTMRKILGAIYKKSREKFKR
ncbi:phosphatase PAP2 family protein [Salinicoccus sesuvii]|uniref:Phosphatase PAP2 family protein n=1 Tax=Salinicoccus sesuvii TaxID=868281 RepID=A0ABV7N301_9STAP